MDEESDLIKAEREEEKRREILQDLMKEIHLFNLQQDEKGTLLFLFFNWHCCMM